ncbi:hypothetical protein PanWU01x14_187210, partial [Parasponia andersonii]
EETMAIFSFLWCDLRTVIVPTRGSISQWGWLVLNHRHLLVTSGQRIGLFGGRRSSHVNSNREEIF